MNTTQPAAAGRDTLNGSEPSPCSALLAWEVEIHDMHCIVFAATKAKAQWIATRSYWEAYGKNGWPRARAWRRDCYDKSRLATEKRQQAWSEDYVQNT